MKIFIWDRVDQCSDRWHPSGGVVVVHHDLEKAVKLANEEDGCNITLQEVGDAVSFEIVGEPDPQVWIMPDAGCC